MIFSEYRGEIATIGIFILGPSPIGHLITLSGWADCCAFFSRMGPEKRELKPVAFCRTPAIFAPANRQLIPRGDLLTNSHSMSSSTS